MEIKDKNGNTLFEIDDVMLLFIVVVICMTIYNILLLK